MSENTGKVITQGERTLGRAWEKLQEIEHSVRDCSEKLSCLELHRELEDLAARIAAIEAELGLTRHHT